MQSAGYSPHKDGSFIHMTSCRAVNCCAVLTDIVFIVTETWRRLSLMEAVKAMKDC